MTTKTSNGKVFTKKGVKHLYIKFQYLKESVEEPTYDADTQENRDKWEAWLERNLKRIGTGTFVYGEAFPGASQQKREKFTRLEGRTYKKEPQFLTIKEFYEGVYMKGVLPHFPSQNKRKDYISIIDSKIIPFFDEELETPLTFADISRVEISSFINWLSKPRTTGSGKPLTSKSIRNTLTVLKDIWYCACDKYKWSLGDPFREMKKFIPKDAIKESENGLAPDPPVWTFDEFQKIYRHIDPHYRNVLVFMVQTGLIASEIAGLRKIDIQGDILLVRNFITTDGTEKSYGKEDKRRRIIPITQAIRACLDECLATTPEKYLFSTKTGIRFKEGTFRKNYWMPALKAAGLKYKKPYTTRHSFASWSLAIGKNMNELVSLMGHASKKMVYEVYGEWKSGLENEREEIRKFFGDDFLK